MAARAAKDIGESESGSGERDLEMCERLKVPL